GVAPVADGVSVTWLKAQGLTVVLDGPVVVLLPRIGIAPDVAGKGLVSVVGGQADRLVTLLDGLVVLLLVEVGVAPVGVGKGEVRLQADGLAVVPEGPVELRLPVVCDSPFVESVREGRIEPN